jgi:hypothetical protein
LKDGYI